jgi:hypothetical protein
MPRENKSQKLKIIEYGWNAQRKATLFYILLYEVLDRVEPYWMCPYCDTRERSDNKLIHRSDCLIVRIGHALNGSHDEIKQMLIDFAHENHIEK